MSTIYLNDMGLCCSLGNDPKTVFGELISDKPNYNCRVEPLVSGKSTQFFYVKDSQELTLESLSEGWRSRNNYLSAIAIAQFKDQVETYKNKYGSDRIAVVVGTSTSGISAYEQEIIERKNSQLEDYNYSLQQIGNTGEFIKNHLQLDGVAYTVSTACSSGAKAMMEGCRLINAGLADACIVGGSDSYAKLTLNGFDSLEAVSMERTNPFSTNRKGINIGEASALFLISKEKGSIAIAGYGESSDGYHISSPDPTAQGPAMALNKAMTMANIKPEDIGYINLHGTGTKKNDSMEAKLVSDFFSNKTPVSSTKPLTGHTLGAAGALEIAFCSLLIGKENEHKKLPIHFWDQQPDEAIAPVQFVSSTTTLHKKYIMSNSFAFGGNNASVILERVE